MMTRSWVVLLVVGLSTAALAQDDDDLVPLGPVTKPKPKAKPKPKPAPKPAPKKPVITDDDELVPIGPMVQKGDLSIKLVTNLSGAVLSIDGKEIGPLPLPPQNINAGEHTVTVKRPGYAAFVKKVMVQNGKAVEVDAKLTATAAVLSVESDVPGAQVLLNGRAIGVAPLNDVEVPPGPAEVAVVKEGFREDTQKIAFVAGKDYPIVVKFNPGTSTTLTASSDRPVQSKLAPTDIASNPVTGVQTTASEPITSKWYFWAGIAVGVAAVSVGTYFGVSEANKSRTFTEKQLCGDQPCDGCIGLMCNLANHPMGSF